MALMRTCTSAKRLPRLDMVGAKRLLLQEDERADKRERVGDAVVDLAQQRLGPLARLAHLALRLDLLAPQPLLLDGAVDRVLQKLDEDAADVLDHVVGGAGLQRGDRDTAFVAAGDVDDGRMIGHRPDLGEDLEAFLARHEMVERDGIEALATQKVETLGAAFGQHDLVALSRQLALHETTQGRVVVDIQEPRRANAFGHDWLSVMAARAPA